MKEIGLLLLSTFISVLLGPFVARFYSWIGKKLEKRRQEKMQKFADDFSVDCSDGEILITQYAMTMSLMLSIVVEILDHIASLIVLCTIAIIIFVRYPNPSANIWFIVFILEIAVIGYLFLISRRQRKVSALYRKIRYYTTVNIVIENAVKKEFNSAKIAEKNGANSEEKH
jgi:hypothetical protein